MDGERECVLAPAALVRSFRDRHPELVAALRGCPRQGTRPVGAPDLCMWRTRGVRAVRLVEVKAPSDPVSEVQRHCLARMAGPAREVLVRLTHPQAPCEPLFGRGRTRIALIPPAAQLDLASIEAKARQLRRPAVAAAARATRRGRGPVEHLGGLREAGLAYVPELRRWAARTEVALLFRLMERPTQLASRLTLARLI